MDYKELFLQYIKNEKNFSKNTLIAYRNDLSQFHDYLNRKLANFVYKDIDYPVLREWVMMLMSMDMSNRTVCRKIGTIRKFFKFLMREEVIDQNPADLLDRPKLPKKLPTFVAEDKMEIVGEKDFFNDSNLVVKDINNLGVVEEKELSTEKKFEISRDRLVVELLYQTGIRRAELCGLMLRDLDFPKMQILIRGKGDKERLVPILSGLREIFEDYLVVRKDLFGDFGGIGSYAKDGEYVFLSNTGKNIYPKLVYRIVHKYLAKVTTMKKKSPHVLRHSFATHLLNNGADLVSIKDLMGHADLGATQLYTHVEFKELVKIFKRAHPRAEK